MIFVFGSNQQGIHGAGAARVANLKHGALMGFGEGRSGNSYALPTKFSPTRPMDLNDVKRSVNRFLGYARRNPELTFQVTQVGCGFAGWTRAQIAPLFYYAPDNCYFDAAWIMSLPDGTKFWGSF